MVLDNYEVEQGDSVFDIILGVGTVLSVEPIRCRVGFEGSRDVVYSGNGALFGKKRLYWRDPIMFVPGKNDLRDWLFLKANGESVLNHIQGA